MNDIKKDNKRWLMLIAGGLMLLCLGLIYGWSIFVKPLAGEFGWTPKNISFVFTVTMMFFCLGGFLGGLLSAKTSVRFSLIVSAILLFGGFVLASQVSALAQLSGNLLGGIFNISQLTLIWLYLTYGCLTGLGVGVGYNVIIGAVVPWFPGKAGLASGALLMGFGTGAYLLGAIASSIIVTQGWRQAFLILGICIAVIMLIGSFLLKRPEAASNKKAQEEEGITPSEMVKKPNFWLFYLWAVLISAGGLAIIGHAATFAGDMNLAAQAVLLTGMLSISNGLGRFLFGAVYDGFGRKAAMLIISGVLITAALMLAVAAISGMAWLVFPGYVLFGLSYGGCPTAISAFVRQTYGSKHYGKNYSLAVSNLAIASFASFIGGAVKTSTGSFLNVFWMLLGAGIAAVLVALALGRRKGEEH